MRFVLAGGSGFLGHALATRLLAEGHTLTLLSRHAGASSDNQKLRAVSWTPDGSTGDWSAEVDGADAVINLAGATIGQRWTHARKHAILESRVLSTRSLVAAVRVARTKPRVFVQMSGAGFYGSYDDGPVFDEGSSPGSDFLAGVSVAWEAEALPVAMLGSRLVILRSGIVLSAAGGALKQMLPPFRFFVGGPIASGRQRMAWIHLDDWVGLVLWAIANPNVSGPINAVAPESPTNAQFAKAVGRAMHRPALVPVPGFMLRLLFSDFATEGLIRGQQVQPRRATELGYQFRYPTIDQALPAALK